MIGYIMAFIIGMLIGMMLMCLVIASKTGEE